MKQGKPASIHQDTSRVSKEPRTKILIQYLELKFCRVTVFLRVFGTYVVCCLGLKQDKLAETD